MTASNPFLDAHSQYYSEYLLSVLLSRTDYLLHSIEMVKETYFVEDDYYDFLVAKVIAVNKKVGLISYLKIYPRYCIGSNFNDSLLGKCNDLIVRFSIFFNKMGFFSPLWVSLFKDGQEYKPEGFRMDWDKYRRIAPKMTFEKYYFLKEQAKSSTFIQNDEVVLRTIPKWMASNTYPFDE